MDMRRINARNYAVYLQRRVEDHGDPERPAPKWSDTDREAVRELVREFRRLERLHELAVERLDEHGLESPQVFEEEVDPQDSAWMTVPMPPREIGSKWWQFWR